MLGDDKMYAAYRLLDKTRPDHSGNREYKGQYSVNREIIAGLVKTLNEREEDNEATE